MLRTGRDRRYQLGLLAVSAVVLAAGILLRPTQPEPEPKPEAELARLQQMTQQRRLRDLSSYLTNAANLVASELLYFNSAERTGIVWESGKEVIAPKSVLQDNRAGDATEPEGHHMALATKRSTEGVPFTVLSVPPGAETLDPATGAEVQPRPGDWVLAVAKNRQNQVVFAHGLYQGRIASRCGSFAFEAVQSSAPLSAGLVGGGLFTLEGGLLGFIADCDQRITVISRRSIAEFLSRPELLNDRLEAAFGMRVADAGGKNDETVKGPGVMVTAVWAHSVASSGEVRPGDVIETVDGIEVHASSDLESLAAQPESVHTLQLRRNRKSISATLIPVQKSPGAPVVTQEGLTLAAGTGDRRVAVVGVAPNSPAERAGILEGDAYARSQAGR